MPERDGVDPEVMAIGVILEVLEDLPEKARARVVTYIALREASEKEPSAAEALQARIAKASTGILGRKGSEPESATVSGGSGGSTAPRAGEG